MHQQVYHSSEIQAWEGRWFAQQNSAYGLMQQVAWATTEQMLPRLKQDQVKSVAVCCGQGNNAGDGYLIASYLAAQGYDVEIYEEDQFRAGENCAGDCLNTEEAVWRWVVDIADGNATAYIFRAGDARAGDRISAYSDPIIETMFEELKPAWTLARFEYEDNTL